MKEKELKKLLKQELIAKGYANWWPAKVRFYQNDIFGVYDCIAWNGENLLLIQMTTKPNVSARKKKILDYFHTLNMIPPRNSFVLAYNPHIDFKNEFFDWINIYEIK